MMKRPRPLVLIILDGWGHRTATPHNAIQQAKKPHWDAFWEQSPHTLLNASGEAVGLPDHQMGNSEVGHLTIGAGRILYQDLTRIDHAIATGDFDRNQALSEAIRGAVHANRAIHVMGLLSDGGVHSHINHFSALLRLAAREKAKRVYFHVFLDGRDTSPKSAENYLTHLMQVCSQENCGTIASIIGRYYAMDRDQRWERIQEAYDLIAEGKAAYHAADPLSALQLAYGRGETDEFVKATAIYDVKESPVTLEKEDTVIFMNFRADRARELTHALIDPSFEYFERPHWQPIHTLTLTEYDATFAVDVAFPPESLKNTLGEYVSHLGFQQLRIAETEKYAHVTFFFNGGIEKPYPHEDRLLIPSPKVATYDVQPGMSALELTQKLIIAIHSQHYDLIVCNFANPDMVGHTGNLHATIRAIEMIDLCIGKIVEAIQSVGGEAILTADHGNAEIMFDEKTQQPHTAHTCEPVPFLYIGRPAKPTTSEGSLSDIAPTVLYLLGIDQPKEMTGKTLMELV